MTLQLLDYPLTSQNNRVGDQGGLTSELNRATYPCREDRGEQIEQAYRQIFFHAMKCDRDVHLESQFRDGSITTRDFIRGLLLSRRFQEGYVSCSTNYRLVDQVVGRALGREVHGQSERISWSILIAEKGFASFVDAVLDSEEYLNSFGYDDVPSQRSRVIPGASTGVMPIYQQFPRYGSDWRDQQWNQKLQTRTDDDILASAYIKTPEWAKKAWLGLAAIGAFEVIRVLLIVAGEMYGTR